MITQERIYREMGQEDLSRLTNFFVRKTKRCLPFRLPVLFHNYLKISLGSFIGRIIVCI